MAFHALNDTYITLDGVRVNFPVQPEHFRCQASRIVCPTMWRILVAGAILALPATVVTTLLLHGF